MAAVIHDYNQQPIDIADEVARDGLPLEVLRPPTSSILALHPIFVLPGAHRDEIDRPDVPVFRRIAAQRVEAWIPREGWLFDGRGKVMVNAHVPRRDGSGRDWLGAFLPDGRWITTDLWENDQQLTCFDPQSDPRWELPGQKLVAAVDAAAQSAAVGPLEPSIGWARADRTGRQWLVSVGTDWARGFLLVTPERHLHALGDNVKLWREVYPRSMGVRGMFTELYIDSDDGAAALHFSEAGHGVGVGWPVYHSANLKGVVINGGDSSFGFWPHSHALYIEADRSDPAAHAVWFFNAQGNYQGQVEGHFLGDAADGTSLLVQTDEGAVLTVSPGRNGPVISSTRRFDWPDGSAALPLAFYDDLKIAFFLRGDGIVGSTDDARRARSAATVVLAGWK
jgi:hypothetical protein